MTFLGGIALGAAPGIAYLIYRLYRRYKDALET